MTKIDSLGIALENNDKINSTVENGSEKIDASADRHIDCATVRDIAARCFPKGTDRKSLIETTQQASIDFCPTWPPDLFAVIAFLLERGGAYHYFSPSVASEPLAHPRATIGKPERDAIRRAIAAWNAHLESKDAKTITVPSVVQSLWQGFIASGNASNFGAATGRQEPIPDWIVKALQLLIIADEVCKGVDAVRRGQDISAASTLALLVYKHRAETLKLRQLSSEGPVAHSAATWAPSITQMFSPLMGAVQPKRRVAQVGTTLRTLSLNLAFLPAQTRINTRTIGIPGGGVEENSLNILLVPFPYTIPDGAFSGTVEERSAPGWGWLNLSQTWLADGLNTDIFCKHIAKLIEKAQDDLKGSRKKNRSVNAIIFPELSLNWTFYDALARHVAAHFPAIQFILSGSTSTCDGEKDGNFALLTHLSRISGGKTDAASISQCKHHRWRIDKNQLESYNLANKNDLDDQCVWWEKISISRRQIHLAEFRNKSSFTVLICEDLARSDPCHEAIRSVGPNIVFCLLMDSVQVAGRWPSFYSLGLAEDPGSSVLTFTSRALVSRSNDVRVERARKSSPKDKANGSGVPPALNWSVALWRNGSGAKSPGQSGVVTRELHCPPGEHAIVLQIEAQTIKERSLDGRIKKDVETWAYVDSFTIALDPSNVQHKNLQA